MASPRSWASRLRRGEPFPIPGGSTEEFNKKCIALACSLAAMRGELLVLRMDNGTKKSFNNKDGSGAAQAGFGYGLADFYPSTHIFFVGDFGADTTGLTTINGRTGRKFNFGYASPKFSPDGNWVVSIEYSGDDEIDSNFAIVDVRSKKPVTVWASKTGKTRLLPKAKFVEWVDDKTIKLMGTGQKSVFLIQANNGAWSISSTPPAN